MKTAIPIVLTVFFTALTFTISASEYYKSTADKLNVRKGPGTEYLTIGHLNKGTTVKVLEKKKGWFKIKVKNGEGFVSSKYLQPLEDKNTSSNSKTNPLIYMGGGILAFLLLLAFLLKRSALKNYGSIITLLATFFYYVIGWFANWLFISAYSPSAESGAWLFTTVFTYLLALVVGILSIIGFFKNVGVGIIVLSAIIIFVDFSVDAFPGVILASMALFGGILIATGYSQIKVKTS